MAENSESYNDVSIELGQCCARTVPNLIRRYRGALHQVSRWSDEQSLITTSMIELFNNRMIVTMKFMVMNSNGIEHIIQYAIWSPVEGFALIINWLISTWYNMTVLEICLAHLSWVITVWRDMVLTLTVVPLPRRRGNIEISITVEIIFSW